MLREVRANAACARRPGVPMDSLRLADAERACTPVRPGETTHREGDRC